MSLKINFRMNINLGFRLAFPSPGENIALTSVKINLREIPCNMHKIQENTLKEYLSNIF